MREGCTHRLAVTACACATAFLLTLAACWALGRNVSSGIAGGWVIYQLARPPLDVGVAPLPAPGPLPTHESYATEPPSFLASRQYQAICAPSGPKRQACDAGAYNASSTGRLHPCTPDSLRHWAGNGRWFEDSDGHYRCKS